MAMLKSHILIAGERIQVEGTGFIGKISIEIIIIIWETFRVSMFFNLPDFVYFRTLLEKFQSTHNKILADYKFFAKSQSLFKALH